MKYICQVCGYVYDEEAEGVPFSELPDDWACPMCRAPKSMFAPDESREKEEVPTESIPIDPDMLKLSPGALAALFSNLARGAEKQYMAKEPELFRKISDYFASAVIDISRSSDQSLDAIHFRCQAFGFATGRCRRVCSHFKELAFGCRRILPDCLQLSYLFRFRFHLSSGRHVGGRVCQRPCQIIRGGA